MEKKSCEHTLKLRQYTEVKGGVGQLEKSSLSKHPHFQCEQFHNNSDLGTFLHNYKQGHRKHRDCRYHGHILESSQHKCNHNLVIPITILTASDG